MELSGVAHRPFLQTAHRRRSHLELWQHPVEHRWEDVDHVVLVEPGQGLPGLVDRQLLGEGYQEESGALGIAEDGVHPARLSFDPPGWNQICDGPRSHQVRGDLTGRRCVATTRSQRRSHLVEHLSHSDDLADTRRWTQGHRARRQRTEPGHLGDTHLSLEVLGERLRPVDGGGVEPGPNLDGLVFQRADTQVGGETGAWRHREDEDLLTGALRQGRWRRSPPISPPPPLPLTMIRLRSITGARLLLRRRQTADGRRQRAVSSNQLFLSKQRTPSG